MTDDAIRIEAPPVPWKVNVEAAAAKAVIIRREVDVHCCKREAEHLAIEALSQNGDAIRPYQVEAVVKAMIAFGTCMERRALDRAAQIAENALAHLADKIAAAIRALGEQS